jgi:hypothetical protein
VPDPHVLYVVSAVVVLALVAWVIVVVTRAPPLEGPPKAETAAPKPPQGAEGPTRASEPDAARTSRHSLDAHMEIQDEKPGDDKKGEG